MIEIFQVEPTCEKKEEIRESLKGYWKNDVWNVNDAFFDELRPKRWPARIKKFDFSSFPAPLKNEAKFMFATRLQNSEIRLTTVISGYASPMKKLGDYLRIHYPKLLSIVDIPYDKALLQWRTYLIELGVKVNEDGKFAKGYFYTVLNQFYSFFINFYDTRDETDKDIWDFRRIPWARITEDKSCHTLNFTQIPLPFLDLAKRYLKFRTTTISYSPASRDVMALRLFLGFLNKRYPAWKDLRDLTRNDMEDYLSWYRGYTEGWIDHHNKYLAHLGTFLDYIQKAQYPEAPKLPSVLLLFREDMPKLPRRTENDIRYIPEGVIQQLEDHLEHLSPSEYIPIVILLRASGWRISDILNLKYNTCLDRTIQGWYLCGDIPKTQVLNHKVPITNEVAAIIQSVVQKVKEKSSSDNNPNHLLFVRFEGMRKGRCMMSSVIQEAINRLARDHNIVDDQGNIFHFGNHAFRHTKAVELINNGMSLLHVQKWLAHASPEMTRRYAEILDTTMRRSWEEATKQGLFRIDKSGKHTEIDITDVQNEDLVEWEYIRSNLDAVRMPLGYCMKPKKQECHTQLIPCLTCRNLCTTPDFIPQYELEIQETIAMIERGKVQGRSSWMEKNQTLLERYESILAVLQEGKTHHKASKKGREHAGEVLHCDK